jgi:hypothetical protein
MTHSAGRGRRAGWSEAGGVEAIGVAAAGASACTTCSCSAKSTGAELEVAAAKDSAVICSLVVPCSRQMWRREAARSRMFWPARTMKAWPS